MSRGMRVLLVGNTAWSMYNFRLGVSKALRDSGMEVIIVAPKDHTSDLIIAEGFQYIDVAIDNKGTSIFQDILLIHRLSVIYKKTKPDLIIHYTIKPNIYGGIAAGIKRINTISFVTGLGSMFIKKNYITKLIEFMYRVAFSFSKEVWFLNESDRSYFEEQKMVAAGRAKVLPGEGIDTDIFHPDIGTTAHNSGNLTFKFIYLGRILRDKGIFELVEAVKILKAKYPYIECQLLGFIDALNPSAISQQQVQKWIDEGLVTYLGQTNDVIPHILTADCVVLPSYREGISRTLLEAAALERPIVATDVTGCREIVDDNVTGLLCEAGNSRDLAAKMEQIILMPLESRKKMGRFGRLKVLNQFDEKIIIRKYKDAIRQILDMA